MCAAAAAADQSPNPPTHDPNLSWVEQTCPQEAMHVKIALHVKIAHSGEWGHSNEGAHQPGLAWRQICLQMLAFCHRSRLKAKFAMLDNRRKQLTSLTSLLTRHHQLAGILSVHQPAPRLTCALVT
eukprot:1156467-Pelagomonas_calceolata.AAC.5